MLGMNTENINKTDDCNQKREKSSLYPIVFFILCLIFIITTFPIVFSSLYKEVRLQWNLPYTIIPNYMDEDLDVEMIKNGKLNRESCYVSSGATIDYVDGTIEDAQMLRQNHAIFRATNQNLSDPTNCQYESFLFRESALVVLLFIKQNQEYSVSSMGIKPKN